jgi:hypothetical protein
MVGNQQEGAMHASGPPGPSHTMLVMIRGMKEDARSHCEVSE